MFPAIFDALKDFFMNKAAFVGWFRGFIAFFATLTMQIMQAGEGVRAWNLHDWAWRIGISGAMLMSGRIMAGDKTPENVKRLAEETEASKKAGQGPDAV